MQIFSDKRKQAGLTFIELLISIMLIGIIAAVLFNVLQSGLNTWRFGDIKMDLVNNSRMAMEKISREMRHGGQSTFTVLYVDSDRDSVEFYADIDYGVNEPDDLELIKYELLLTGQIQKTITDSDMSVNTFILAKDIVSLHFTLEQEVATVVVIRLKGQREDLVVNIANKVFPRNM